MDKIYLDVVDGVNKNTALHLASSEGHLEVVKYLEAQMGVGGRDG